MGLEPPCCSLRGSEQSHGASPMRPSHFDGNARDFLSVLYQPNEALHLAMIRRATLSGSVLGRSCRSFEVKGMGSVAPTLLWRPVRTVKCTHTHSSFRGHPHSVALSFGQLCVFAQLSRYPSFRDIPASSPHSSQSCDQGSASARHHGSRAALHVQQPFARRLTPLGRFLV